MPFLEHDGIRFYYEVSGSGPALVFCHGLTGDLEQPKELLGEFPQIERQLRPHLDKVFLNLKSECENAPSTSNGRPETPG